MNIDVDTLIVPKGYTAHFRALEMKRTIEKGNQPATADREAPGVPTFNVIALPWVQTNTGYWWAMDSKMKNGVYGLQFKESAPIQLDEAHIVYKTKEIQYQAWTAFDLGHNDYRGLFGSKSTNAS